MTLAIYGIKNCNSMKKAFDKLGELGVTYEFFDYKKQVLSFETFSAFVDRFGVAKLINKQGTTYRKLDDAAKLTVENAMNDANHQTVTVLYELVAVNQSLLKRPIIVGEYHQQAVALIGFDASAMQETFA